MTKTQTSSVEHPTLFPQGQYPKKKKEKTEPRQSKSKRTWEKQ